MRCSLIIVRYPKWMGWAGLLSMALFRLPLYFNKRIGFWKLLGCGRNGSFDIKPDWRQWGVMIVWSEELGVWSNYNAIGSSKITPDSSVQVPDFLSSWWHFFGCEVCRFDLVPVSGHGSWNGKACFGELPGQVVHEGRIAVLTRATIRLNKLKQFWQHVNKAAAPLKHTPGFIFSVGIGELPWIKQATFSIWENEEALKAYAYQTRQHTEVIRRTRQENWYSEEMFVRFRIIAIDGSLPEKNPLA